MPEKSDRVGHRGTEQRLIDLRFRRRRSVNNKRTIEYTCFEGAVPEAQLAGIVSLHNETFGSGIMPAEFRDRLERKRSLLCLVALCEKKPVGYKVGYERNTEEYFSWLGGVRDGFRRQGIATELMKRQHTRARELGYKRVLTESDNQWRDMIVLNLRAGFEIVGTCTDQEGRLKIIMGKNLLPPPREDMLPAFKR
jgi:GNAT superfamily N-acetyltransferase